MLENFLLSPWVLCSDILERKIENMEFSGLWGVYSFVYVIFNNFPAVLLAALIIFILANVAMEFGMKTPQNLNAVEIDKPISVPEKGEKKASNKSLKKKGGAERWSKDNLRNSFAHDWLLTSLKGHKGPILDMDFSSNGKYLATCAQDRAIFVWSTKHWRTKDHKFIRYNVDLDHASLIRWSPDSKAFLFKRHLDNFIQVCKVIKKEGAVPCIQKSVSYEVLHRNEMVGFGIDVNGRYLMSCSSKEEIVLVDLKGTELTRLTTYLVNNLAAKVSPCGRFVAASGFVPDVNVWNVQFSKTGEYKQVIRAFDLTSHSSGVIDFAFNADSTKVATVSKDCSWKLFDINIEFTKGENPHLIKSGGFEVIDGKACLALSPDAKVLALATHVSLTVINLIENKVDIVIPDIYSAGVITKLVFDSAGEYILTAGEKHVRVFHNVTGYKVNIHEAKQKLMASDLSSATRERLQQITKKSEDFLNALNIVY